MIKRYIIFHNVEKFNPKLYKKKFITMLNDFQAQIIKLGPKQQGQILLAH